MRKAERTITAFLAFFLAFFISQEHAFSQQIPSLSNIPQGSVMLKIEVTERMMNYQYQLYVTTNGNFPIWTVFYNMKTQNPQRYYPLEKMSQKTLTNNFYVRESWKTLEQPGIYLLSMMGFDLRIPVQNLIQTLRISSNDEKALQDKNTLIVNDSTGVAPRRGSQQFNIRYQLNEDADIIHMIIDTENDKDVYNSRAKRVPKGTRGFDWDSKDAKKEHWYRSKIEATSITDKAKWDHDLSERFQTLK